MPGGVRTLLADLWMWLEALPLAEQIGATWWLPPARMNPRALVHLHRRLDWVVDLRLLNLAGTKYPVTRIIREVIPWTYAASAASVVAGAEHVY